MSTGCQVSSLKWWDEENELVKSGYVGPKGETDFAINDELRKAKDQMDMVFKYFEINEKIRITTYKGSTRTDEVFPKWAKIGTHTGRRTFIVHALSLGIAPDVVMKWTGHADYKAMRPYIDIVDSIKAESMTKFNNLL